MFLLLALAAVDCTRTVETRSESAVQETAAVHERASSTLDEVVQTGPSTTTVYKFAPPETGSAGENTSSPASSDGRSAAAGPSVNWRRAPISNRSSARLGVPSVHDVGASGPYAASGSLLAHGPLVEMDVIQTGPILDTKRQADKEASSATQTVKTEEKAATKTKTAPALSGYLWMALAAVVVGGIGWAAWKLSPLGKIL